MVRVFDEHGLVREHAPDHTHQILSPFDKNVRIKRGADNMSI
jgi:hypothetical protein